MLCCFAGSSHRRKFAGGRSDGRLVGREEVVAAASGRRHGQPGVEPPTCCGSGGVWLSRRRSARGPSHRNTMRQDKAAGDAQLLLTANGTNVGGTVSLHARLGHCRACIPEMPIEVEISLGAKRFHMQSDFS